jgi:hypothetical protein
MVEIVKKYYCDRCGAELKKEPISLIMSEKIGTYQIKFLSKEWYSADLCLSCAEAFEQWWMEGKHGKN